jgi:hypothetical protein
LLQMYRFTSRSGWNGLILLQMNYRFYIICNKFSTLHHDLGVNLYLICNKLSPLHPDLVVNL